MKKLLLLPLTLILGGCATYGYSESYAQDYTSAHTARTYVVPVYDSWVDQPFWTLDPWYYPAAAYRGYSYGVTWVNDWDGYYAWYGYPYSGYTLHYSPTYGIGWYNHGYSHGGYGYHGIRDFWWQDHYPYTTRHGARREISRLQRQHRVPDSAHRYSNGHYNRFSHEPTHVGSTHAASYTRHERTRSVRGHHGIEDGHRGRSSVNDPHAGYRNLPFNRSAAYRHGRTTYRVDHARGYSTHAPTENRVHSKESASRELRRIRHDYRPVGLTSTPARQPYRVEHHSSNTSYRFRHGQGASSTHGSAGRQAAPYPRHDARSEVSHQPAQGYRGSHTPEYTQPATEHRSSLPVGRHRSSQDEGRRHWPMMQR